MTMHELSIAQSLAEQVARHTPPGHRLVSMRLRIGARQGVDPDSLKWSWEMVAQGTPMQGSALDIEMLPWRFRCPQCQRQWEGLELLVACECGCATPAAEASADLTLLSLEVEPLAGDKP
jgi:hydrogenase nickel incorporation protein HypA/HybF